MVQYPFFSHEFSPSITGTNVYAPPGRSITSDNNESEVSAYWPFNGAKWKAFNVKIRVANGGGTLTVQRRVNEADVGVGLTFTSADGIGTIKTDGTIVDVEKGDRIGIRFIDTSASGDEPIFHYFSYIEFADGLWGF